MRQDFEKCTEVLRKVHGEFFPYHAITRHGITVPTTIMEVPSLTTPSAITVPTTIMKAVMSPSLTTPSQATAITVPTTTMKAMMSRMKSILSASQ